MHNVTRTSNISLARELQKHLSNAELKNGFIDQGKYKKMASRQKWTESKYRLQETSYVAHKDIDIF